MLCPKGRVGSTPTTGTSAVREADQVVLQRERRRLGTGTDTELGEELLTCRCTVRSLSRSSVAIM
jgi:hypothetical protein